jgi:hypothetical protein
MDASFYVHQGNYSQLGVITGLTRLVFFHLYRIILAADNNSHVISTSVIEMNVVLLATNLTIHRSYHPPVRNRPCCFRICLGYVCAISSLAPALRLLSTGAFHIHDRSNEDQLDCIRS